MDCMASHQRSNISDDGFCFIVSFLVYESGFVIFSSWVQNIIHGAAKDAQSFVVLCNNQTKPGTSQQSFPVFPSLQASQFLVKIHTNSLCRRWAPKGWRPWINGVPSPAPPTEPPVAPDRHGTELTLESWLCQPSREPSRWAVHGRNRPLQPLSLSLHPRGPRLVQVLLCLQRAR